MECAEKPGMSLNMENHPCAFCDCHVDLNDLVGNISCNIDIVKHRARGGHAWAQEFLGFYTWAARDDYTAFRWFRKAAGKGHPMATVHMGDMLCRGTGCKQNLSLARENIERAILLDENIAEYARGYLCNVGVFYGQRGDSDTAISILTPLAELGIVNARLNLGVTYSNRGELTKALDLYRDVLATGANYSAKVGMSSCYAMICCKKMNQWPQAKFWLSNSTKNLHEILADQTTREDSKEVLELIHNMRLDLRKIRDRCGGCGAELQGKMRIKCSGCTAFCYCNRDCQKLHWNCKKDGHREDCKEVMELKTMMKEARRAKDKTAEK